MTWNIVQIIIGVILLGELILCIINSKIASDYTYYLCRPFCLPLGMAIGSIVRLVCAVLGGILLYRGIIGMF